MEGFDYDRASETLAVPEEFEVEAMAAVGKPAPAETLPEDYQEREEPPGRRPLEEIVHEGRFEGGS